jgi:hypothetical protein
MIVIKPVEQTQYLGQIAIVPGIHAGIISNR